MLDFAKCCRMDGRTTVRRVQSGSMSLPDECMVIRVHMQSTMHAQYVSVVDNRSLLITNCDKHKIQ